MIVYWSKEKKKSLKKIFYLCDRIFSFRIAQWKFICHSLNNDDEINRFFLNANKTVIFVCLWQWNINIFRLNANEFRISRKRNDEFVSKNDELIIYYNHSICDKRLIVFFRWKIIDCDTNHDKVQACFDCFVVWKIASLFSSTF